MISLRALIKKPFKMINNALTDRMLVNKLNNIKFYDNEIGYDKIINILNEAGYNKATNRDNFDVVFDKEAIRNSNYKMFNKRLKEMGVDVNKSNAIDFKTRGMEDGSTKYYAFDEKVSPQERRLRLTNPERFTTNEMKISRAAVVSGVATTQAPERKAKTAISQYKPVVKGLKKSLTDQLNKRPWSEARNELIYKIEMMDELNLSQLYHENKELFAIYYYGDSPEYVEEYDSDKFVYGYNDVVVEYEKRFGVIL